MKQLAIITTHPIQYYAPVFQLLQQRNNISIKVFYTWGENSITKYDPNFGKTVTWDIPLLEGYDYEWVNNTAPDPGSHHFKGIINPNLIAQVQMFAPGAVLVFGWAYQSHLKLMRHFKGKIPVYFRGDSTLLDEPAGLKNILKSIFLKWVYSHVDHAFYVGQNNKVYFKKFGLRDDQLSFAPHAVDNVRFAVSRDAEAQQLKKVLNIAKDDILILFAGKLEAKKSPLLLLNSFLTLQQLNLHLLFVGNGNLEQDLKVAAHGAKNIHFMDFQNQTYMPVVYQACDLFCLPSKGPGETWGLAINEAMACKKAILVTDKVGCAIDLVKNDVNGYVFQSGDEAELLVRLKNLTRSKNKLIDLGKNSGLIIKEWNFTAIAGAIENKLINEAH